MSKEMILDKKVVPARFTPDPDAGDPLPLEAWLQTRSEQGTAKTLGVLLEGDERIDALRPYLAEIPFVALHLPKWADGRIYSHARRLRELWKYDGIILAHGDVLRDQLLYMSRSGINAFYMREDQDLHASLAAFDLYTEHYQYN